MLLCGAVITNNTLFSIFFLCCHRYHIINIWFLWNIWKWMWAWGWFLFSPGCRFLLAYTMQTKKWPGPSSPFSVAWFREGLYLMCPVINSMWLIRTFLSHWSASYILSALSHRRSHVYVTCVELIWTGCTHVSTASSSAASPRNTSTSTPKPRDTI